MKDEICWDVYWKRKMDGWLKPFLERLPGAYQQRMVPMYLEGLWSLGERKSIEAIANEVAPGAKQNLHHLLTVSAWDEQPLWEELARRADEMVGGPEASLIVDDVPLQKKGHHSVGVANQWCGRTGRLENCQVLVSLTLAKAEVPVAVGLRLYLPQTWVWDLAKRREGKLPIGQDYRTKWQIALEEIDRVRAYGVRFGTVLADAGYGVASEFRRELSARGLSWAVGVESTTQVYPATVEILPALENLRGRPAQHDRPSVPAARADRYLGAGGNSGWRWLSWRQGVRGKLRGRFAAARVKLADGAMISRGKHLPGIEEVWVVCEWRENGEKKYYVSNLPKQTRLVDLVRVIKDRWVCEQAHQQLKEELGLDHYEGRAWRGLHRHALLNLIAFAFLQYMRLENKKNISWWVPRPNPVCRGSADNFLCDSYERNDAVGAAIH